MNQKYTTALIIGAAILIWLLSGQFSDSDAANAGDTANSTVDKINALPLVRGRSSQARLQHTELLVRGRTEQNRQVLVRAEVAGRVVALPVDKGAAVNTGDLLCEIAVDSRASALTEAKATQHQADLEYRGIVNLGKRGLQAETTVAQSKANLEAANTALSHATLQLDHTRIASPFKGVVEQQPVEIGDFLKVGDVCAQILDTDPILLVGQVAEKNIRAVSLAAAVNAKLLTGEHVTGTISFISQAADPATHSYRIEVEVANSDRSIRAGITSELLIPLQQQLAHAISPAILLLDDNGTLGVKTVNAEQRVEFHPVTVIAEGLEGVWVTGLPETTTFIVIGQELVFAGDQVRVELQPLGSPQAAPLEQPSQQPSGHLSELSSPSQEG